MTLVTQKMSKILMRFNYKKYKQHLLDTGGVTLRNITVEEHCFTVAEILASPIDKYINISVNNCGYCATEEDLIFNYVHPLFLNLRMK